MSRTTHPGRLAMPPFGIPLEAAEFYQWCFRRIIGSACLDLNDESGRRGG